LKFAHWLDRHRRSVLTLAAALALAGIAAAVSLPITLYPQTDFPRVRVNIDTGSEPAHQMMLQVTEPIEAAVRAVPEVVNVTSTTSRGSAQLFVDFRWGTDMASATLAVNAALAQLLPNLPAGANYSVLRMDPNVFPFMAYALTSATVSQVKLRDLAKYQIAPLLSGLPGIARVQVQGGDVAEVEVALEPQLLAAYHLTVAEVANAISAASVLQSVGRVSDHDLLYLLMDNNALRNLHDVQRIVVRGGPDGVVRLSDIATVRDGTVPRFFKVSANGKQATTVLLFQQRNSNSVAIAKAVKAALAGFSSQIPPGVHLSKWYDQSTLVMASAGSVRDAIVIGVVLAAGVLLFFLRNWRITLLAILVVPASLAAAVMVLSLFGLSFNIMTLGGLAASVGLVIDDVIVMIEHIARRAAGGGADARLRILDAGAEFLTPLSGSSGATLIVFAPLGFLSGVTGAFFKALSITMAATLIASWLLAAFAVPLLARTLVDFSKWHDPGKAADSRLDRAHGGMLRAVFARPWLLAVAIAALLALGIFSFQRVQTGFLPHLDEGGFVLDYQSAPGTSLGETAREIGQVEQLLRADPAVASFSTRVGAGFGGDLAEPNQGDIVVRLIPLGKRPSIFAVMARLRTKIDADVPGLDTDLHQLMGDEIGDLTGLPEPIDVKLSAADPAQLDPTAKRVADLLGKIKGVDSVVDGVVPAGDSIDIKVDPVRAAMLGLDPAKVAANLRGELAGEVTTQLLGNAQETGVRVRLPAATRRNTDDLKALPIATPSGALVPLGQIAKFSVVAGQPEITRDNLQQVVDVTARITGRGIGGVVAEVKQALSKPGVLGPGVTYTLGGLYKQQQIAFAGLLRVFVAALLAESVLLLFLYERFMIVAAIMATGLLSTTAVFTGLFLTGVELNITALMGMTMIIGIATEMAIFYVSEFQLLERTRPRREALIEAAANRLRPIAMTTLAAILTLLPLALDLGQGAGMQQPLAIAIISGLLVQFPLVLLGLPVLLWFGLGRARAGA
jgi:multidrug efflux pump subunit AcrB